MNACSHGKKVVSRLVATLLVLTLRNFCRTHHLIKFLILNKMERLKNFYCQDSEHARVVDKSSNTNQAVSIWYAKSRLEDVEYLSVGYV